MRAIVIGAGLGLLAAAAVLLWQGAFAPRPGQDQTCARRSPPWSTADCYR